MHTKLSALGLSRLSSIEDKRDKVSDEDDADYPNFLKIKRKEICGRHKENFPKGKR